jgi:hypothetical protein
VYLCNGRNVGEEGGATAFITMKIMKKTIIMIIMIIRIIMIIIMIMIIMRNTPQ